MKVYIVSIGEDDYYSLCGIFSTEELAQQFKDTSPMYYDEIEEWELDPKTWFQKTGLYLFAVVAYYNDRMDTYAHMINENDKPTDLHFELFLTYADNKTKRLIGNVLAKDQQDALRIIDEKRTELINSNLW